MTTLKELRTTCLECGYALGEAAEFHPLWFCMLVQDSESEEDIDRVLLRVMDQRRSLLQERARS